MTNPIVQEIKEELQTNDCNEFLKYLGVEPEDFDEFNDVIEFDDYSR